MSPRVRGEGAADRARGSDSGRALACDGDAEADAEAEALAEAPKRLPVAPAEPVPVPALLERASRCPLALSSSGAPWLPLPPLARERTVCGLSAPLLRSPASNP